MRGLSRRANIAILYGRLAGIGDALGRSWSGHVQQWGLRGRLRLMYRSPSAHEDLHLDYAMTRALVIEPTGNLWGSERTLLDFVGRMPEVEAAVCCPPGTPIIAELEKLAIRTLPYFMRVWGAVGVVRACLEFRPDVIYLNQGGCYRVTLPAAVLFNLPIVAHVRIFKDITRFGRRCPNPRRLHGIVAVSSAIAKELRRWPQLSAIPQHMLYDEYVPSAPASRSDLAERMPNRVACIGRIAPNKGQSVLIDATHWLSKNSEKIECLIVGDGRLHFVQQLKAAAADGPGASVIKWLGVRSDVVSLLRTCTALACPSHREALGRVIFEAWDAGAVPVACITSAGAAEVIAAADGGILYAEQTPQSLARALQAALRLPQEEVARLIGNGRSWMSKHCDPRPYNEALAKILCDAAASQRNPAE